ncbi:MAG: transporter substrate-binding domain-containing protein [Pseudomonadota bacterium]
MGHPHLRFALGHVALAVGMFAAPVLSPSAAMACSPAQHQVAAGDTVFTVAETYYGDIERWSLIFYSNQSALSNPLQIPAGTVLTVPCPLDGSDFVAEATPLQVEDAEMMLVTGGNYAPFTDRAWPGQGMITELVNAAMEETPSPVTYSITWEDDWSRHLFPMLDSKEFDMGFPWFRPDCESTPDHERCKNFHFSDPIVELLGLLFVPAGSSMTFDQDSDIHGKTLCRPAGYFTFDLDSPDRLWLTNGLVELETPATPADCFRLLLQGQVDAVALNEFTGWTTLADMGLRDQVAPLANPLGVQGLHVIISKRHWRGTTHLYRFNAGLKKLKDSERYDQIVSRHLGVFWDRVN